MRTTLTTRRFHPLSLIFHSFLSLFLLSSCSTPQTTSLITVFSTPATAPWLGELFDCANQSSIILHVTSEDPEIFIRIGEPENLTIPAYQVDVEELLIVAHRDHPMQSLTLEQAQTLFAQGNESMQLWGYASEADVQIAFDQGLMQGRSVSSNMRIATDPQVMSDILSAESNSIGIMGRYWLTDNLRVVFSAGEFPVLALTKTEPQGAVKDLILCLQK